MGELSSAATQRATLVESSRRLRASTRENCAKSARAVRASRVTLANTRLLVSERDREHGPFAARRLLVTGERYRNEYFSNPLSALSDLLAKSMGNAEPVTLQRGRVVLCRAVGGRLFATDGTEVRPSEVVLAIERILRGLAVARSSPR